MKIDKTQDSKKVSDLIVKLEIIDLFIVNAYNSHSEEKTANIAHCSLFYFSKTYTITCKREGDKKFPLNII